MIDLDKLGTAEGGVPLPISGRHCQGDADIFAYECCDLDELLESNIEKLKLYIEQQRIMAGAEHMNLHLTMGSKAGRYEMAQVKEYQANRQNRDPAQQERVWALRDFMASYVTDTVTPYAWTDREADDGMAQFQIARIKEFGVQSSVIMTMDKDLRMVPGLHIHPKTYDANEAPDGYGECYIDESTSTKTVKGWGTSFFWHQMLMGDTADNIPGLPRLCSRLADKYLPVSRPRSSRDIACGAVTAFKYLDGCRTDMEACQRVIQAYQAYYGNADTLMNYKGVAVPYTFGQAFIEQAYLLWMQRTEGEHVKEFLKELPTRA